MKKKKTPTSAATLAGAAETAAAGNAPVSTSHFISANAKAQGRIEALLPRGESNALTTRQLVELTGKRDKRALQAQIEAERSSGALICSKGGGRGGYFLPENREEIARYEATLRRRALSTLRTLKAARRALHQIDSDQIKIEGV